MTASRLGRSVDVDAFSATNCTVCVCTHCVCVCLCSLFSRPPRLPQHMPHGARYRCGIHAYPPTSARTHQDTHKTRDTHQGMRTRCNRTRTYPPPHSDSLIPTSTATPQLTPIATQEEHTHLGRDTIERAFAEGHIPHDQPSGVDVNLFVVLGVVEEDLGRHVPHGACNTCMSCMSCTAWSLRPPAHVHQCTHVCACTHACSLPRLHYRLLTLCPAAY